MKCAGTWKPVFSQHLLIPVESDKWLILFQLFGLLSCYQASIWPVSNCGNHIWNPLSTRHVPQNFGFPPSHHEFLHHDTSKAMSPPNGKITHEIMHVPCYRIKLLSNLSHWYYAWHTHFRHHLEHWLPRLRFFSVLLSPSWQIQGQHPEMEHFYFVPQVSQFAIYDASAC